MTILAGIVNRLMIVAAVCWLGFGVCGFFLATLAPGGVAPAQQQSWGLFIVGPFIGLLAAGRAAIWILTGRWRLPPVPRPA